MMGSTIFDADELEAFKHSVDRFVSDRSDGEAQRDATGTRQLSRQTWQEMADLGWLALSLPAEHGGMGGGAREASILMNAIGTSLMPEPFLASIILGGGLISLAAETNLKDELLPLLANGQMLLAFADMEGIAETCAEELGGEWFLTGNKRSALHGDVADALLVSAQAGAERALFLVDANAQGLHRTTAYLIDGRPVVDIRLDKTAARRVGSGDASVAVSIVRDHATAAICAEAVGAMNAMLQHTLDYARTRQQFGVPIGSFQVIQHRLVDMMVAIQEAEAITAVAAEALDSLHPAADGLVSAAKLRVNQAAKLVGEGAIQLHGGIGMTSELSVGRYFKRLLVIASLFGGNEEHLDRLSVE